MKSKIFISVFFALLLIALVSATFSVSPTTLIFGPNDTSRTFTLTNTNSSDILDVTLISPLTVEGENGEIVSFNVVGTLTGINAAQPSTITITPSTDISFSDFYLGKTYSSDLIINEGTESKVVKVQVKNSYCKAGDIGDLELDLDIQNVKGFGDDEEWFLFDEIKADITVDNTGSKDVDSIIVEWGLYNTRTGKFVFDNKEKKFNLNDGDDKTITVTFELDANDFEADDSEDDFVFYVKAYSDKDEEENQCVSLAEDNIKVMRDSHFVVAKNIVIPEAIPCGETVELSAKLWNIGDDDENDVLLLVRNTELKINEKINVGDVDLLDDKSVSFNVNIPEDALEKTYSLIFEVYDEDNSIFENDNNDKSVTVEPITISGNCKADVPAVGISAVLDSEAVAGKDMKIKVSLQNNDDKITSYQIKVVDYDSWASLKSIEPATVTLSPGNFGEVTVTIVPNKDVVGDREFKVQVLYDGNINEQTIKVPVEASSGFFPGFTGFAIFDNIKDNWFIWLVGALNVILVVLIIVVAVRVARR